MTDERIAEIEVLLDMPTDAGTGFGLTNELLDGIKRAKELQRSAEAQAESFLGDLLVEPI